MLYRLLILFMCFLSLPSFGQNKAAGNPYFDSGAGYYIYAPELKCKGIPDSIFHIKHLKHLSVQGKDCDFARYNENGKRIDQCCGIGSLPAEIGELKELVTLSLPLNGIEKLPDEIINCQELTIIDLTDNNVDTIDNLVGLKNLSELELFGCYLKRLPANIGEMKNLKQLGLTGNHLEKGEIERVKKALPNCTIIYEEE